MASNARNSRPISSVRPVSSRTSRSPSAIRSALAVSCRREMTVSDPTVTPMSANPITVNSVVPTSPESTAAPAASASSARRWTMTPYETETPVTPIKDSASFAR